MASSNAQKQHHPLLMYSSLVRNAEHQHDVEEVRPLLTTSSQGVQYSSINGERSQYSFQRSLSDSWKTYNDGLESNPIAVKSLTAFFILGIGDLCAQGIEHLRQLNEYKGVDWLRSTRFGAFGFIGAPWAHYYFYYLDLWLPPTPEPFTMTTLLKLLIDQGIQAPLILALIIFSLGIMKGEGVAGAWHDLSENYRVALLANWELWLPANFVNYAFIKPSLRVLYVNAVFFVWTIILSMMLNSTS